MFGTALMPWRVPVGYSRSWGKKLWHSVGPFHMHQAGPVYCCISTVSLLLLFALCCLQISVNRARLAAVLAAVEQDVPRQLAAAAERQQWEAEMTDYMQVGA
jgi:hypothetical protein